jgi:hypothetical protein
MGDAVKVISATVRCRRGVGAPSQRVVINASMFRSGRGGAGPAG